MPGQGIVTIGENQWTVSIASTPTELTAGLSGVASIPPGSGVLFDMGSDQGLISINTSQMLFNLDIVFISSQVGVLGRCLNIAPGEACVFEADGMGARYFLEVNAGEAEGVSVGDDVSIQGDVQPSFWAGLIVAVRALAIVAVVGAGAYKMVTKEVVEAEEIRHRSNPGAGYYWRLTDVETGEIIEKNLPYSDWAKVKRAATDFAISRSKYAGEHEIKVEVFDVPGATELSMEEQARHRLYEGRLHPPSRTLGEHHSIHGPRRQKLVDQYGTWAVGRAESVCPEGDVECVEMEAARLLGAYRRGFGV